MADEITEDSIENYSSAQEAWLALQNKSLLQSLIGVGVRNPLVQVYEAIQAFFKGAHGVTTVLRYADETMTEAAWQQKFSDKAIWDSDFGGRYVSEVCIFCSDPNEYVETSAGGIKVCDAINRIVLHARKFYEPGEAPTGGQVMIVNVYDACSEEDGKLKLLAWPDPNETLSQVDQFAYVRCAMIGNPFAGKASTKDTPDMSIKKWYFYEFSNRAVQWEADNFSNSKGCKSMLPFDVFCNVFDTSKLNMLLMSTYTPTSIAVEG